MRNMTTKAAMLYMNKDTGEILNRAEMLEQWRDEYDGDDPTNGLTWREQYDEIEEGEPQAAACENDDTENKTMKNMTTKAAMEYIETLHQRGSNDARYMSIYEKVKETKRALIKERDELESKCNAYDTYVSLCCERGGSYDAFYSFSDSLYDSMRDEILKHVDDDEAVYDSVRDLSDCDVVAMYIELFEVDEAEVFKKLDSACDELRDAVVNEIEYMTDYDENETLYELRNALKENDYGHKI